MRVRLLIVLAGLIQGCIAPQRANLETFKGRQPRSIVVAPVVNESRQAAAGSMVIASITEPLAERGYYVFPVYLTDMVLLDSGFFEPADVHQLPAKQFHDLFGADAVLLITIKECGLVYLGLASTAVVSMEYVLIDTQSGEVLWKNFQRETQGSGGGGLVSMAVSAALDAVFTDFLPLARRAHFLAFEPPRGIPAGPYHPQYQHDKERF